MSESDALILAAQARLDVNYSRLDAKQDSVREDMATIRVSLMERTDRLEAGFAAVREEMTSLRVGLMDRMDRLQNSLTSIRDDIGVNMGGADRAHEAADGTRAELRALGDQVNAMSRQITIPQAKVREIRGDP